MARLVASGTPSRTNRYVYPRPTLALFAAFLLGGIVLAAGLILSVFTGTRSLGSPGPVSRFHANFESNCAACHGPRVADARCEHCHDPAGNGRLENAGHVWFGAREPATGARARSVACARCHTDHRGRTFPITGEDDRHCRSCHFFSLSAHPEFALVKTGAQKEEGLQFSHKKHLKAVAKANLDECQFCHESTSDRRAFQPLNFDQQCARCHLPKGFVGSTDPISRNAVTLPQDIDAPWAKIRPRVDPDVQGRVVVASLAHRDPWILFNLSKIAREVDPEGAAARRGQLARRIADVTAQLAQERLPVSRVALQQEAKRLVGEIAKPSTTSTDRARAQRALVRSRLQLELGPAPMASIRPRPRTRLEETLRQLRSDLANLADTVGPPIALSEAQKEARLAAVAPLTAPCALCHLYDGPWMRPVRVPASLLPRANFSHRPHLQQLICQACHAGIAESRKAENVNLPAVRSCEGCHRHGRSRTDCAECHTYHPQADPWPPI